jgi:hypothetical protein
VTNSGESSSHSSEDAAPSIGGIKVRFDAKIG